MRSAEYSEPGMGKIQMVQGLAIIVMIGNNSRVCSWVLKTNIDDILTEACWGDFCESENQRSR